MLNKRVRQNIIKSIPVILAFYCYYPTIFAAPKTNNNINFANNIANNNIEAKPVQKIPMPPSQWPFSLINNTLVLKPSASTVRARIEASNKTPELADPIKLRLHNNNIDILINKLSQSSNIINYNSSINYSTLKIKKTIAPRIIDNIFTIIPDDLNWINLKELANILQTPSFSPELKLLEWDKAQDNVDMIKMYFGPYYKSIEQAIISFKQQNSEMTTIPLAQMTPSNVRKLYGKYSHLKGRNCFGTALDFANSRTVVDKAVNSEQEKGHFAAMINSDEFLQALWLGYYELRPEDIRSGLRWGDVVVFYDSSRDFSWGQLKHAMVHLGGQYYFQKASKSASSPIEITTWDIVSSVWSQLTKRLDYKVYRRLPARGGSFLHPEKAIEKFSWTK